MPIDTNYLLETLKKSIQINSIIPHEEKYASFIADEIRKLGIEPEWHEVAPGRPNVYASVQLGSHDDMLLLTGHMDTVAIAENWETNPFDPVIKEGRLYGLGSLDMKSGVVCALTAFKALIEDKSLHSKLGRIAFAATVDEEGYGLGAKALLETDYAKAKGILLPEPFGGDGQSPVPSGITGKVLYKLTLTGKMSHGFYPEDGINAIEEAGKIIAALPELPLLSHPEYGQGNYSVLKIEGGYQEYAIVVPEKCEIIITRLTIPGENRETAVRGMQNLIESLDLNCDVKIETPAPFYDPFTIETDSHFAQSFASAYQQQFKHEPPWGFIRGITDGNIYVAEGGIPTINLGPAGKGLHQCNEYVEIKSLEPIAQILHDSCVNYFS